jgi:hypothetical protein
MKKIDYTMYNRKKRRRQIYVDIDRTTAIDRFEVARHEDKLFLYDQSLRRS